MYKIDTDKDNKLIHIELSGRILWDELQNYTDDAIKIIHQFGKNEVLILAILERLDPFAQSDIPLCIEGLYTVSGYIKKIAFVHKRVVTRMQMDRIVKEVNSLNGGLLNARSCNTKKEALKFLYE